MSLLSDTNHSPQRVFALLRLLAAEGGELDFESIKGWFKPEFRGGDNRGSESEHINIRQMLGAATSLKLIESDAQNRYRLVVPVPSSLEAFADAVHDRLIEVDWSDADSIVLEAFAAMVALTELEQGTTWLDLNAKDRAARINKAVRRDGTDEEDESKNRFNSTKAAPWKRWIIFLGLGIPMPKGDLYPYPARRLEREIGRARAVDAAVDEAGIEPFLELIAARMPYLDGGRLFRASADQIRLPPMERRLTRVLTGALRDLHDDKRLALETVGDAKQTYAMTGEPHVVKNVKGVRVIGEAAHV
jgi:hypothetical protein